MTQKSWVEQQEENSLFRGKDVRQLAERMLEISSTNRIVTAKGSKLLMVVRMLNKRLGDKWDWLSRVADMGEEYQLTIGEPKNSRQAFVEALKTELDVQAEKSKKDRLLGV